MFMFQKCYIVKHQNRENTSNNANDPATINTQIKDPFFENNTHYSSHDDNEIVNLSPTDIKVEFHKDNMNSRDDENKKKKDYHRTKSNSKQIIRKNSNSTKIKKGQNFICTKCKAHYGEIFFILLIFETFLLAP